MGYLIVPMVVESFINGRCGEEKLPLGAPDYREAFYRSFLGSASTPRPFNRDAPALKPGVHLHFVLPDAFTRADEEGIYRAVPNRYLVTRIALLPEGGAVADRFHVESDFLSQDSQYAGNVTLPMFSDGISGSMFRYVGRCWKEGQEPSLEGTYMERLTAVGPGDPAFAAYYPSCHSVFGFQDPLEGIPLGTKLTYFVVGYFSDRKADPLEDVLDEEGFQKVLREQGFAVGQGEEICQGTLLFGEVSGLVWLGREHDYGKKIPQGEIQAAVGNTSAEALGAVLGRGLGGEERYFTALQYDLLSCAGDVDGNFKIDDGILAQGFEAAADTAGGISLSWEAGEKRFQGGREFSDLVKKRERRGQKEGILASLQSRLYLLWERYMRLYERDAGEGEEALEIRRQIGVTLGQMQQLQAELKSLGEELAGMEEQLKKGLPQGAEYLLNGGEPFYIPKDPAVLLWGEGIRRSFAFGEDGRFREDGMLLCQREPLTFGRDREKLLELFEGLPFRSEDPGLESCWEGLFCQAVFLGEDVRGWAEERLGALCAEGEYSPILLSQKPQEFTTLYMDWSLRFYPTRTSGDGEEDNTLRGWKFPYGETSYVYEGERSGEKNLVYTGRTVATPHAVYSMKDMLSRWLEEHGEDREAAEAARQLGDLPVLSQTLGGLNEKLCGLEYGIQFPPVGEGEAGKVAALVAPYLQGEALSGMDAAPVFSLRGGHFRVDRLDFISTFGQVQHCIVPPEAGTCMQKILYAETIAGKDPDYGMLSPGILLPTKLAAQWRSAACRDCVSSVDMDTTPVCGFLLPEILNRRLLVYTQKGVYLGMLKTVWREGRPRTCWISSPGRNPEPGELERNGVLRRFLQALLDRDALEDILGLADRSFDRTLESGNVSLIWGRPLALARLSLRLQGRGMLPCLQPWVDAGKGGVPASPTQGVEKISVPVHFGDVNRVGDGLLGVFPDRTGQEAGCFDTLYPAWGEEAFASSFISFEGCPEISFQDGEKFFTLLMEAGSECTLQTGLLPVKRLRLPGEALRGADRLWTAAEFTCVLTTKGKAQLPVAASRGTVRYQWSSLSLEGETPREVIEEVTAPTGSCAGYYLCDGFLQRLPLEHTEEV